MFFKGVLLITCERFSINFLLSNNDVALSINARLPQNFIVRNSRIQNKWGWEESTSPLSFQLKRGQKFDMQVLVTDSKFYISVNGFHFATYAHRLHYNLIKAVEVRGDVTDVTMDMYVVSEYPIRLPLSTAKLLRCEYTKTLELIEKNKPKANIPFDLLQFIVSAKWMKLKKQLMSVIPLPFYGRLPGNSFSIGHCLRIEGRVRLLPETFIIDLQKGQDIWPQPTVAFRFNPRFLRVKSSELGKAVITRNAYMNGEWLKGEISLMKTDLRPGKAFKLLIVCKSNEFAVYINRNFVLNYKFRMQPEVVNIVNIRGDVRLWDVVVENAKLLG